MKNSQGDSIKMKLSNIKIDYLNDSVSKYFDDDFELLPSEVKSIYGQKISLVDDSGFFIEKIRLEHVGYSSIILDWGYEFCRNIYVEWIFRSFFVFKITTVVDLRSLSEFLKIARSFDIKDSDSFDPEKAIYEIFNNVKNDLCKSITAKNYDALSGARSFFSWGEAEGFPGFNEEFIEILNDNKFFRKRIKNYISFRDPMFGPYTSSELDLIDYEVSKSKLIENRKKSIFLLCRDWGLRPVQISLLFPEDVGKDEFGFFIMVPSVKGIKRSVARRASSNLVKRYIAEDTYQALLRQIDDASHQCYNLYIQYLEVLKKKKISFIPKVPIFPATSKKIDRLAIFALNPDLREYALLSDSHKISFEIKSIGDILDIKMSRFDPRFDDGSSIKINAYRLRRTKGTSLVLAGHNFDEVAESLDHQSTNSVSHYFQYSLDVHRFVDEIAARSPEINEAVARWEGKFFEDLSNTENLRPVSNIGFCSLNGVCHHQPVVTCYSCDSFNPMKSADHKKSLKSILIFKKSVEDLSSIALSSKLNREINGAISLIKAIENEK